MWLVLMFSYQKILHPGKPRFFRYNLANLLTKRHVKSTQIVRLETKTCRVGINQKPYPSKMGYLQKIEFEQSKQAAPLYGQSNCCFV